MLYDHDDDLFWKNGQNGPFCSNLRFERSDASGPRGIEEAGIRNVQQSFCLLLDTEAFVRRYGQRTSLDSTTDSAL